MKNSSSSKKYRFFYHYFKQKGKMTVHYRKQCIVVKDIVCYTACKTKWNKTQPQIVMQGWAEKVLIENDTAYIY